MARYLSVQIAGVGVLVEEGDDKILLHTEAELVMEKVDGGYEVAIKPPEPITRPVSFKKSDE